jgi:ribosome-associated protein
MENNALEIANQLVGVLEDKKAENILLMDIQGIASFADYFIFASGTSDRMLRALSEAVKDSADRIPGIRVRQEGSSDNGWVVVDCGDIVIHLFSPTQRDYYRLEELWDKGKVIVKLQ